tara:strand:+ start:260 stop:388 length:129 start_codon:yes stop_codon:yes gene_type:complete
MHDEYKAEPRRDNRLSEKEAFNNSQRLASAQNKLINWPMTAM